MILLLPPLSVVISVRLLSSWHFTWLPWHNTLQVLTFFFPVALTRVCSTNWPLHFGENYLLFLLAVDFTPWVLNSMFLSAPRLTSQSLTLFLHLKSVSQSVKLLFFLIEIREWAFQKTEQCAFVGDEEEGEERLKWKCIRIPCKTGSPLVSATRHKKELRIHTPVFRAFVVIAFACFVFCLSLPLYFWKVLFPTSSNHWKQRAASSFKISN